MRNFFIIFNDINMQENIKVVKVNNFVTIKSETFICKFCEDTIPHPRHSSKYGIGVISSKEKKPLSASAKSLLRQ